MMRGIDRKDVGEVKVGGPGWRDGWDELVE